MFRAVLPRATPRAALRAAGPKASNFAIPTQLFIGVSKRGYASEAGESKVLSISESSRRVFLSLPGMLLISDFPVNRRPRFGYHRWWCRWLRRRYQGWSGGSEGAIAHELMLSSLFSCPGTN